MTDSRTCALVTGASSGIGAVYADRLAARGYDLTLHDRHAWTAFDDARRTLSKAISQNAVRPACYGLPAPEAA